jgi:tetratricopeptide (TPR) repeat protein
VSRSRRVVLAVLMAVMALGGMAANCRAQAAAHTDPLNLDPIVRQGYERFYNLDYDGALKYFNQATQQHPQEPMSWNYVLMATIFRELYHQDLLDTTYYAHDSFLSTKREVEVPQATRDQINSLTDKVIAMCDARIKNNPNDKNAYFARGYAHGMHSAFITLVDHSFASAAKQGYEARNDSEAALKIDPQYADAKMAIGIQQFAVASLPRFVRLMVGIMGVGGSKEKGLDMLREASAHGVITGIESRTTLSLFLRHDGRYAEALQTQRGLAEQYPHDYLFQLEVANLLKDSGQGLQAIEAYKHVLELAQKPGYFVDPRLQMAWFGLADTQRGYNDIHAAAEGYMQAAMQTNCSDWLRKRAQLNAGEMYDLLHDRAKAVQMYQMAAASSGDQSQAEAARKYQKTPFTGK